MKALFIGNSHTFYNDMPQTFARLYEQRKGGQVDTVMLAHPAVDLEWHMKHFFDVRYNLLYGHFDYCFVQQQAHPFPGKNTTKENVIKINELCKRANTKLIVTLPWAKRDNPEDQQLLNEAMDELEGIDNVTISPVGKIWLNVKNRYPDINLFASDHAHASAYGDYLLACTHYAVVTGDKATGLLCSGGDFLQGKVKCPDNSGVINDINKVWVHLEQDKCKKIQTEIDAYFLSMV